MKRGFSIAWVWALAVCALAGAGGTSVTNALSPSASEKVRERWKDARFGLFIHWGPVSQIGKPLSHSRNSPSHRPGGKPYKVASIPAEEYDQLYKTFNPTNYDPMAIVRLARRAGMRYVVFTAKHHAGFSMFDSAVTDYDIMAAPYHRDILQMLADACRRADLHFGFYYSPRDWHHPDCDSEHHHDRYIHFFLAQLKELLTHYGPVFEIWFDGLGPGGPKGWGDTPAQVMAMIRRYQPDAMVNDRCGPRGDFYTPEHYLSFYNARDCWEACHTITSQWGYNPNCAAKPFPFLLEILLYTWGSDGNVLLNIGPRGDGSVNPKEEDRLMRLAGWWVEHGETAIRRSRGGPYLPGPWGVSTRKGRCVYLHVFRWPSSGALRFPAIDGMQPRSARLLAGNGPVRLHRDGDRGFIVSVPLAAREPIATTIELLFDRSVMHVPVCYRVPSLTVHARLSSTPRGGNLAVLCDQNARTAWQARVEKSGAPIFLEARFDRSVTVGSFAVQRGVKGGSGFTVQLEIPDGKGGWQPVSPTKRVRFLPLHFLDRPVTSDHFRLRITGTDRFTCAEWELFPPLDARKESAQR